MSRRWNARSVSGKSSTVDRMGGWLILRVRWWTTVCGVPVSEPCAVRQGQGRAAERLKAQGRRQSASLHSALCTLSLEQRQ